MLVAYIDDIRMVGEMDGSYFNTNGGKEYILFMNSKEAGEAAREYWEDMARCDKAEFTCLVGEETLISWGLGEYAGPGTTQVTSLEDWLDLWLNTPEEFHAMYDSLECEFISRHPDISEFTVAYRIN